MSSKIRDQRWNLHFERKRVLHYFDDEQSDDSEPDVCNPTNPVKTAWPFPKYSTPTSTTPPPIPSSKYPLSPSVTTFTTSPTSTSPPTNPSTKWYQNSLWPSKSQNRILGGLSVVLDVKILMIGKRIFKANMGKKLNCESYSIIVFSFSEI